MGNMKMQQNIKDNIINLIEEKVQVVVNDDILIQDINLDSIDYIEIIVEIENMFNIEFDSEALVKATFLKVSDLIEYVQNKVNEMI